MLVDGFKASPNCVYQVTDLKKIDGNLFAITYGYGREIAIVDITREGYRKVVKRFSGNIEAAADLNNNYISCFYQFRQRLRGYGRNLLYFAKFSLNEGDDERMVRFDNYKESVCLVDVDKNFDMVKTLRFKDGDNLEKLHLASPGILICEFRNHIKMFDLNDPSGERYKPVRLGSAFTTHNVGFAPVPMDDNKDDYSFSKSFTYINGDLGVMRAKLKTPRREENGASACLPNKRQRIEK